MTITRTTRLLRSTPAPEGGDVLDDQSLCGLDSLSQRRQQSYRMTRRCPIPALTTATLPGSPTRPHPTRAPDHESSDQSFLSSSERSQRWWATDMNRSASLRQRSHETERSARAHEPAMSANDACRGVTPARAEGSSMPTRHQSPRRAFSSSRAGHGLKSSSAARVFSRSG